MESHSQSQQSNKSQSRWWVDVALFILFIVAFLMDTTGLALHQWLGVIAGVLALYHLATHWNWVKAITARFLGSTTFRARAYYVIDAALLGGFFTIIGTGLVISTWFNLALPNYAAWYTVHVAASLVTLLATVLKIGLHWRWIANTVHQLTAQPAWAPVGVRPVRPVVARAGRREFLKVAGVTAVAVILPLGASLQSLTRASTLAASTDSTQVTGSGSADAAASVAASQADTSGQVAGISSAALVDSTSQTVSDTTASVATQAVVAPTATAQPTTDTSAATVAQVDTTTAVDTSTSDVCTVRCRNGCSFPGRCRRYTDANGNGKCDLGECA
jgi:hypothetical protein